MNLKLIMATTIFTVLSTLSTVSQAQTVGAPPASCWVPQQYAWQVVSTSCPNGSCFIEMLPIGLGVCSNGVVMVPLIGSACAAAPGEVAGSTFRIPSDYASPGQPYSPPVCAAPAPPAPTEVSVYRFYRPSTGEHFLTLNQSEGINAGFNYEGVGFKVFADGSVPNTHPIYRCYWGWKGEHFISLDSGCEGQSPEGAYGYIYNDENPSTSALVRTYNPYNNDHLESADPNEVSVLPSYGYNIEGTLGFVPAQ